MDMLATTHVEREGVYLWANQLVYGSGADIIPSEKPIDARLPSIKTGFVAEDDTAAASSAGKGGKKGRHVGVKGSAAADVASMLRYSNAELSSGRKNNKDEELSASEDENDTGRVGGGSDEDEEEEEEVSSDSEMEDVDEDRNNNETANEAARAVGADPSAGAAYKKKDSIGAPIPLAPEMVTLSLLPRTQWLNLVHLDTIKARNKPIEAPQKSNLLLSSCQR